MEFREFQIRKQTERSLSRLLSAHCWAGYLENYKKGTKSFGSGQPFDSSFEKSPWPSIFRTGWVSDCKFSESGFRIGTFRVWLRSDFRVAALRFGFQGSFGIGEFQKWAKHLTLGLNCDLVLESLLKLNCDLALELSCTLTSKSLFKENCDLTQSSFIGLQKIPRALRARGFFLYSVNFSFYSGGYLEKKITHFYILSLWGAFYGFLWWAFLPIMVGFFAHYGGLFCPLWGAFCLDLRGFLREFSGFRFVEGEGGGGFAQCFWGASALALFFQQLSRLCCLYFASLFRPAFCEVWSLFWLLWFILITIVNNIIIFINIIFINNTNWH